MIALLIVAVCLLAMALLVIAAMSAGAYDKGHEDGYNDAQCDMARDADPTPLFRTPTPVTAARLDAVPDDTNVADDRLARRHGGPA